MPPSLLRVVPVPARCWPIAMRKAGVQGKVTLLEHVKTPVSRRSELISDRFGKK